MPRRPGDEVIGPNTAPRSSRPEAAACDRNRASTAGGRCARSTMQEAAPAYAERYRHSLVVPELGDDALRAVAEGLRGAAAQAGDDVAGDTTPLTDRVLGRWRAGLPPGVCIGDRGTVADRPHRARARPARDPAPCDPRRRHASSRRRPTVRPQRAEAQLGQHGLGLTPAVQTTVRAGISSPSEETRWTRRPHRASCPCTPRCRAVATRVRRIPRGSPAPPA